MAFSCRDELCFNGGTCGQVDANSTQQQCICPSFEYGPDQSFFHDMTCTMPQQFFLGQLIEMSIICFAVVAVGVKATNQQTKLRVRRTIGFSTLATVFIWGFSLGTYVQNGAFEVTGICLASSVILCSICALDLIHIQIVALKGVDFLSNRDVLFQRLFWTSTGYIFCMAVTGVAWVVLCRTEYHNHVGKATFCVILFFNALYALQTLRYANKLVKGIKEVENAVRDNITRVGTEEWNRAVARVKNLRWLLISYFTVLVSGILPILLTHFALTACPFGFVLILIAQHSVPTLCCATMMLARNNGSGSTNKVTISTGENEANKQIIVKGVTISSDPNNNGIAFLPSKPEATGESLHAPESDKPPQ